MGQPRTRYYRLKSLFFVVLWGGLSGCREGQEAKQQVVAELERAIGHAQAQLERLKPAALEVPARAGDELEKMYAIEYRVIPIEPDEPSNALEARLNALGKERWECVFAPPSPAGNRLLCRRLPLSYLRLLGQFTRIM